MTKAQSSVDWPLLRPLIIFGVICLIIFSALQLTLRQMTNPAIFAGCKPQDDMLGILDPSQTVAIWQGNVIVPPHSLASSLTAQDVSILGEVSEEKWIEVDLVKQKLIAHQGDSVFLESAISSGLWNSTPVGEYRIWYKVKSTKMEGGSRLNNTYYYLPNVPYAMFFHGNYGIHGTYWHNDFGTPRSHGCINSPTSIAEKLYHWSDPPIPEGRTWVRSSSDNPGTRVIVHK